MRGGDGMSIAPELRYNSCIGCFALKLKAVLTLRSVPIWHELPPQCLLGGGFFAGEEESRSPLQGAARST